VPKPRGRASKPADCPKDRGTSRKRLKVCVTCGAPLPIARTGRPRLYCGPRCKLAERSRRQRADDEARWAAFIAATRRDVAPDPEAQARADRCGWWDDDGVYSCGRPATEAGGWVGLLPRSHQADQRRGATTIGQGERHDRLERGPPTFSGRGASRWCVAFNRQGPVARPPSSVFDYFVNWKYAACDLPSLVMTNNW
jgi:hypothetical protein